MGKYAAKKGCATCAILGELCFGCAVEWREQKEIREIRVLRRIERACRRRYFSDVVQLLVILDKARATKPRLKSAQAPSETGPKR